MKHKLWITLAPYLAYCIDKELYKVIEYLKAQVDLFIEQQQKQNKHILLSRKNSNRSNNYNRIGSRVILCHVV
jgi:hypothetical protein